MRGLVKEMLLAKSAEHLSLIQNYFAYVQLQNLILKQEGSNCCDIVVDRFVHTILRRLGFALRLTTMVSAFPGLRTFEKHLIRVTSFILLCIIV